LGQIITNPKLGLFLQRGDVDVSLGYGDFLRGLKKLKVLPLKELRWNLKNKVFRVSIAMTVFG